MTAPNLKTLGVKVDWSTEPHSVYSNVVSVSCRPEDFALTFCSVSPGATETDADGNEFALARIVSAIRTSPSTYLQLLAVMTETWNKWLDLTENREMPKLPVPSVEQTGVKK